MTMTGGGLRLQERGRQEGKVDSDPDFPTGRHDMGNPFKRRVE